MKKRISAFLLASAVMIASSGCSAQTSGSSGSSSAQDADAKKIVLAEHQPERSGKMHTSSAEASATQSLS